MIHYRSELQGCFVRWPKPPNPERHLDTLRGSYCVVLTLEADKVVGFITAISDGVLSAYLPLLEVLPEAWHRQRAGAAYA